MSTAVTVQHTSGQGTTQTDYESTSHHITNVTYGTSPGDLVQLDPSSGKLPAVDGSLLTNLPGVISQAGEWKGAYDNSAAYSLNDLVSYLGNTYICILASAGGHNPSDAAYWSTLGLALGSTSSTQSFGDTASGGSATTASRSDHKHGMPAAPNLQSLFPITSIYITATNVNPSLLLGFGTWIKVGSGTILVGGN